MKPPAPEFLAEEDVHEDLEDEVEGDEDMFRSVYEDPSAIRRARH